MVPGPRRSGDPFGGATGEAAEGKAPTIERQESSSRRLRHPEVQTAGRQYTLERGREYRTPTQTAVSVLQYQDSMGWFGTPGDACRAFVWLSQDDQAHAILTNAPLSPNPELWPELGFKGGSDNGVATAAWWMRAGDGQTYVAVVSLVNRTSELDLDRVIELMVELRDETMSLSAE